MSILVDSYNRVHNYLRISLTDNCNLRCFYCMPEEDHSFTPSSRLMQAHEIQELATIFVEQGIQKIRLTGGEPLVRKDAADIILSLANLPVTLTLTTNGTRLHEYVDVLQQAKIRSLNISLDTLQSDKFQVITRRNQFNTVVGNIHLLIKKGFQVKINVVVMKGLNDGEINDFLMWTKDLPVEVRFIEFMPFSGNRWTSDKVVSLKEIIDTAGQQFEVIPLAPGKNETAKRFMIPGHAGSFAVISTMSANFCGSCNRLRLTADGKMKNCLFAKNETDLLTALRNGDPVLPLIRECVSSKAKQLGGQFSSNFLDVMPDTIQNRSMISIGG